MFSVSRKSQVNSVKEVAQKHYKNKVGDVMSSQVPSVPPEGWVRTIRKALEMSGAQLAATLSMSRNRVSVLERREVSGDITLNQLRHLAQALDADLVYAIVPKRTADEVLNSRAQELAQQQVDTVNQNMFLEQQQLSATEQAESVAMVAKNIRASGGRVMWGKPKVFAK
jgi:predicted DNA-binding mobile mystery protein A